MKAKQYKMPKHAKEDIEQGYLFEWADRQECVYPELWLLHHIPNGGKRDPVTGAKLKRQGVKKGVPDITLPVPRGIYHGLYMELKVNDNTTSDEQDEWLERLAEQGYSTHVCWGHEEAIEVIKDYLKKRSGEA